MKHFKKVSLMLAVLCMWVGCVMTVQAANGPNTGEYSAAYINIYNRAERIQIILYMLQVHKKQRL